jgi:hypothetical protein
MPDPIRALREALDSPTVHASRRDPIRARLDEMAEYSLGCPSICCYSTETCDALRAVLDLCDPWGNPPRDSAPAGTTIRRVIAEHLGVTDE